MTLDVDVADFLKARSRLQVGTQRVQESAQCEPAFEADSLVSNVRAAAISPGVSGYSINCVCSTSSQRPNL